MTRSAIASTSCKICVESRTVLLAPKGTPQAVIDKLNAEVVKILILADIKERFAAGGVETIPSSAAELDARIKQDAAAFLEYVKSADFAATLRRYGFTVPDQK